MNKKDFVLSLIPALVTVVEGFGTQNKLCNALGHAHDFANELEEKGYFDPEPKPEPEPEPEPTQKEIRTFADLNDHIKNKKPRDLEREYPMTVRPQEGAKVIINRIVMEYFGGALYQNGHGRNDEYIHKWEDIGVDLTWRYAK